MASSKVMASSNSRKSDLSRRSSSAAPSTKSQQSLLSDDTHIKKNTITTNFVSMTIDGILQDVHGTPTAESTLLDAQITLIDTPAPPSAAATASVDGNPAGSSMLARTVDDVWRDIVSGDRLECKEELPDDLMTLEDFLAKADAVEEDDLKMPVPSAEKITGGVFTFDQSPPLDKVEGSVVGFGNGVEVIGDREGGRRGKRGHSVLEPLDKAAQQKQRRMIKNRESAARSRERKQAYQVELESLAVKLEEENEHLLKEKEERRKDRYKQIMERVIPVVEKRKPPRLLRRVHSLQW